MRRILTIASILCCLLGSGRPAAKIPDLSISEEERVVIPTGGDLHPPARATLYATTSPQNVNMIGSSDLVAESTYQGRTIQVCTPGKEVPQNELAGAVNPSNPLNLVAGSNDYHFLNLTSMHYTAGGGVYRSVDGGKTWNVSFLPEVVQWNTSSPGKYRETSDPSISASTRNTFWYGNLVFNRESLESALAVSRSTNGGATWRTKVFHELDGTDDVDLFTDKPWIGADPTNPNIAHIVWVYFRRVDPERSIGYSRTTNGGKTWSKPQLLLQFNVNLGPQVAVDTNGVAHVVWLSGSDAGSFVGYTTVSPKGSIAAARMISRVREVRSPVPWGSSFYTNSFPRIAIDGRTIHVVWANWNGKNADIVYIRSSDGGTRWSKPVTIAGGTADQFLPAVAAAKGTVAVGFSDHAAETGPAYHPASVVSKDSGITWSQTIRVSTASSQIEAGNHFSYPQCDTRFIGDYNDVAVDSNGQVHVFWTDIRNGNSPGDPGTTADQDPYTAAFSISQ